MWRNQDGSRENSECDKNYKGQKENVTVSISKQISKRLLQIQGRAAPHTKNKK